MLGEVGIRITFPFPVLARVREAVVTVRTRQTHVARKREIVSVRAILG